MSIVHLLPLSIIVNQSSTFGVVLVVSILISAIIWDLGAWYLALPVSSSHALIGSILGVSIAIMYSSMGVGFTPHWSKAQEVIIGLLISPMIGFGLALILIYIAHIVLRKREYFKAPYWSWDKPNLAMRSVLIGASGLVSFMHGKNDGQKGVGIATLILVTLIPGSFAIDPSIDTDIARKELLRNNISTISSQIDQVDANTFNDSSDALAVIQIKKDILALDETIKITPIDKLSIRKHILSIKDSYSNMNGLKGTGIIPSANASDTTYKILGDMKK